VAQQGNFEGGASVLSIASTLEKVSQLYRVPIIELEKLLDEGRQTLFAERERRVRPGRDEKILTSWNGLMVSGFIDGFKIAGHEPYLAAAKDAVRFILQEMRKDGQVMRVFNKGKCQVKGYSEDYAFFIQALIDLYEATFELEWLKEAEELNRQMTHQFWDERDGGFFFSGKENESLIARSKNPYDHVIPSANSVAVFNLIRLGYLTGEESLKQKAEQTFHLFYDFLDRHPSGFAQMLSGLSLFLSPEEIGVIGSKHDPRTMSMLKEIYLAYLPNKILSLKDPQEKTDRDWIPFLKDKEASGGPTTFICKNFTCLPPIKDEEGLRKVLK
jgi:hypothetical protein